MKNKKSNFLTTFGYKVKPFVSCHSMHCTVKCRRLLRGCGCSNIFMGLSTNLYGGYQCSVLLVQGDQSGPGEMRAIDNRGLLMTGDVSLLSRPGQAEYCLSCGLVTSARSNIGKWNKAATLITPWHHGLVLTA